MEYAQDIILDVNTNTAYTTIGAKQSDHGTRIVHAYITDDGETFDLSEVTSVYYRLHKPDGKAVINPAVIIDNTYVELWLIQNS